MGNTSEFDRHVPNFRQLTHDTEIQIVFKMLTVTNYTTGTKTSNTEVIVYIKSTLTLSYPCNYLRIGCMSPLTVN